MTPPRHLTIDAPRDGFDGFVETILRNPATWAEARVVERGAHLHQGQIRFLVTEAGAHTLVTKTMIGPATAVPLARIVAALEADRAARTSRPAVQKKEAAL